MAWVVTVTFNDNSNTAGVGNAVFTYGDNSLFRYSGSVDVSNPDSMNSFSNNAKNSKENYDNQQAAVVTADDQLTSLLNG